MCYAKKTEGIYIFTYTDDAGKCIIVIKRIDVWRIEHDELSYEIMEVEVVRLEYELVKLLIECLTNMVVNALRPSIAQT
ncbi:hypothetical protein Zmor_005187 [Zophobas morio]|uniref:Uncharacterized protein n=1 Tax=Zophobas morio TaxID=2755281 RepID=A0AA38INX6_9CUCU|nr:hypothetical protein Zmor_005187 [Zophobas morio]